MSTTAQTFFLSATDQDDAWGTDVRKLLEAVPALTSTTLCDHPNAAGTTDITLDPYSTTSTQSDLRTNLGWAINQAGADGLESVATARRIVPAGVWTFTHRVTVPNAGAVTGSLTVSLLIKVYRVGASPGFARTELFAVTSDTVATAAALGATGTVTASSASQPQISLEAGETLHVGYLSHLVQVAGALGATVVGRATYHTGTEGGVTIRVDLPAPGVRTQYPRALADTASLTDALVRRFNGSRAAADSAPLTDSVARSGGVFSRAVTDNAPLSDTVARRFIGTRAAADSAPLADALTRAVAALRALTDSAPLSDTLARSGGLFSRALTDSAPLTDTLARRFTGARALTDSAPLTDSVARVARFNRLIADSAPLTDSMARSQGRFTRTSADSAPLADAVSRRINYARGVQDDLAAGGTVVQGLAHPVVGSCVVRAAA